MSHTRSRSRSLDCICVCVTGARTFIIFLTPFSMNWTRFRVAHLICPFISVTLLSASRRPRQKFHTQSDAEERQHCFIRPNCRIGIRKRNEKNMFSFRWNDEIRVDRWCLSIGRHKLSNKIRNHSCYRWQCVDVDIVPLLSTHRRPVDQSIIYLFIFHCKPSKTMK